MPGFFQEHLRPLAGSTGLHVVLVALLIGAAVQWRSEQPPVELAIEGYVADLPPDQSTPKARAAPPPAPAPKPVEAVPKPPEPAVEPPPERRAEEAAAAERAAQAEKAAQAEREKRQADERAREKAAADQDRAEEEERKRAAEVESKRKAVEEEARRKAEAAEAKRKAAEQAQADREAKARSEREAELQRSLAAEEESAALARSGVMDEYRSLLVQTIERSWIRPPSARAGLECTLYVTQAPGGTVIDVKLGPCNGDQATRESITNAVFRASPLPAPRDPRAFERRLEIVFKPTE
ncbi:MAG: colicin import rane protein [Pseudomonadota bacterium]|nr:colicin import rane protein [Pseudomonadota bacterium]